MNVARRNNRQKVGSDSTFADAMAALRDGSEAKVESDPTFPRPRTRRSAGWAVATRGHSIAVADFARSRSTYFWILPVDVFGSSQKTIFFGALKRASSCWQWAISSASVAVAPGFSSTNAHGVSPHFGSGWATTAATTTAGWRYSASSTSSELMFSPPEMITSLLRSLILT